MFGSPDEARKWCRYETRKGVFVGVDVLTAGQRVRLGAQTKPMVFRVMNGIRWKSTSVEQKGLPEVRRLAIGLGREG
jgi:hypothetical protein